MNKAGLTELKKLLLDAEDAHGDLPRTSVLELIDLSLQLVRHVEQTEKDVYR